MEAGVLYYSTCSSFVSGVITDSASFCFSCMYLVDRFPSLLIEKIMNFNEDLYGHSFYLVHKWYSWKWLYFQWHPNSSVACYKWNGFQNSKKTVKTLNSHSLWVANKCMHSLYPPVPLAVGWPVLSLSCSWSKIVGVPFNLLLRHWGS